MSRLSESNTSRLASSDILRGFDLFFLVFPQPVFATLVRQLNLSFPNDILYRFDHEVWEEFRFWDLMMPLFLFMTGASMLFSLSKYAGMSGSYWPVYRGIPRRVFLLPIFGMIVQGNLLGLNSSHIHFYSNTLQSIIVSYFIAAVIQLHFSFRRQIGVTLLLLFIYWISMAFLDDFTPTRNFAEQADRWVLGRFRDGVFWNENRTWSFSPYYNYTWIWSSLAFGVTIILGAFVGKIMKEGKASRKRVVQILLVTGVLLTGLAMPWSLQMPIIKRLWTGSMILLFGGYCFLLMVLLYYWIDYKGYSRELSWLKVYGMNSTAAYLLGGMVNFRCITNSVSYRLRQYIGDYRPIWLTSVNYLILSPLLGMVYKRDLLLEV